jgi:hypothetical protein
MSTIRSDLDTAKRQLETAIEVSSFYNIYFLGLFSPPKNLFGADSLSRKGRKLLLHDDLWLTCWLCSFFKYFLTSWNASNENKVFMILCLLRYVILTLCTTLCIVFLYLFKQCWSFVTFLPFLSRDKALTFWQFIFVKCDSDPGSRLFLDMPDPYIKNTDPQPFFQYHNGW